MSVKCGFFNSVDGDRKYNPIVAGDKIKNVEVSGAISVNVDVGAEIGLKIKRSGSTIAIVYSRPPDAGGLATLCIPPIIVNTNKGDYFTLEWHYGTRAKLEFLAYSCMFSVREV